MLIHQLAMSPTHSQSIFMACLDVVLVRCGKSKVDEQSRERWVGSKPARGLHDTRNCLSSPSCFAHRLSLSSSTALLLPPTMRDDDDDDNDDDKWNWNFYKRWYLRREKIGARTRTKNKLNPHITPDSGTSGPRLWETSVLTTAPSLLPCPQREALTMY